MIMEDSERLAKNQRIKETQVATRARRASMVCRTYETKIDESHLSKRKALILSSMFLEAKWFCNQGLQFMNKGNALADFDYKTRDVEVLMPDGTKDARHIEYLPAACRQALIAQMLGDLKGLSVADRKGRKTGHLKFKSNVRSLSLRQYGNSYSVDFGGNRIRINGVGVVRVRGLQQLPEKFEWSCARLVHTSLGYFVKLTVYFAKPETTVTNGRSLGIDFGCKTAFVTSDGDRISVSARETDRLKRFSRKSNRCQTKGSKRHRHVLFLLDREYERLTNRKNEAANQLAHKLRQYDRVVIQDEQLKAWQKGGHGKAVQHSCLGRVKRQLLESPNVVVLDRWVPTTKLCTSCGTKYKVPLSQRVFTCPECSISEDRDVHAARNMIWFADHHIGIIQLGTERTKVTRGEFEPLIAAAIKGDCAQVQTSNREASCSSDKR
jgi:putative transposase